MNKLSTELLSLIFSHLHREQKIQCRLVCRSFANALRNGHDLETVVMSYWPSSDKYGKAFTKLVEHVRADPIAGKKCKRLVLDGQINILYRKQELGELFPNLNCLFLGTGGLIIIRDQRSPVPNNSVIGPDPLQYWRENLETLLIEYDASLHFDILGAGVFRNLTTIVLGAQNENRVMTLNHFQNTPALKNLVIASYQICPHELEKLHENAPNLESLTLLHADLKPRHKYPQVNQPAKSLKKLIIKAQSVSFTIPRKLAEYIIQKYPNVQHFTLLLNENADQFVIGPNTNFEISLCHILTKLGPNLESVKSRLPFFSSNAMNTLTKCTGQVQELEMSACLGKTKLYKILSYAKDFNIQTLYLTQVPPFSPSVLKGIDGLKSLGLVFKDKPKAKESINFTALLRHLTPNIESLEIGNAAIIVNSKTVNPSNIRTLVLKTSVVPTAIQELLNQHFYQLKCLTLDRCQLDPVFVLPSHHLSYFEISMLRSGGPYAIRTIEELEKHKRKVTHLQVTLGETTSHYRFPSDLKSKTSPHLTHEYFDKHDHAIRSVCRPTEFEDGLTYFQFKCASAQTIFYNGYLAL
jgi:hypothetical protein